MSSTNSFPRSPQLLDRNRSQLLIVDVQEKLLPVIEGSDELLAAIGFLLDVADVVSTPVYVSEQYPKGLGLTVAEIASHAVTKAVFEKLRFSAAEEFLKQTTTNSDDREQVIVVGIESHICVLQTTLDLLNCGKQVFVVTDAIGSRNAIDQQTGVQRIRDAGAILCTAESAAFELCEVAGTDEFRQISRLVRARDSDHR